MEACRFCSNTDVHKINVYKHIWFHCPLCNNASKIKKENYALQILSSLSVLIRFLIKIPKGRGLYNLLLNLGKNEAGIDLYDHYLEDGNTSSVGTPWEGESTAVLEKLRQHIPSDLGKMKVLDVSGGPGYVISELRQHFSEVAVTEYSPQTVKRMKELLGLNFYQYDFNSMQLRDVVHKKFGLVLSRHAINFSIDINDLARNLSEIVEKNGFLYLSFVINNVQTMVRWQMEDYIYEHLFDCDFLVELFGKYGFRETHREMIIGPHYLYNKGLFKPVFYWSLYANKLTQVFKRDPKTKSAILVFRKL